MAASERPVEGCLYQLHMEARTQRVAEPQGQAGACLQEEELALRVPNNEHRAPALGRGLEKAHPPQYAV